MEKLKVITKGSNKKKQLIFHATFMLLLVVMISSCHNSKNIGSRSKLRVESLADNQEIPATIITEEIKTVDEIGATNKEDYDHIVDNPFMDTWQNPLSTFSIDVDNASYSNVRRFINNNELPPKGAVRIEEMVNYFSYDYPKVNGEHPFELITELGNCPWNEENKLVHIGIQGKQLDYENIKASNLTFLIDVSGSMNEPNKLPLVKKSLNFLLQKLSGDDRVSIVVYAGAAGLILPPTSADNRQKIMSTLDQLSAGGSTAGGEGIELAYKLALQNKISNGNNRVVLVTDGDFNVGRSSTSDMVELISEKRNQGVYLTICGFGMGNYNDGMMEQISNAGNGNYFYIDNIKEAEKVFGREMRANMFTIAKDVKIQIEFNPLKIKAYRLIGYENRLLANQDFDNDQKDAGELGAGHTVTALYEIIPVDNNEKVNKSNSLRYQKSKPTSMARFEELINLNLRYKSIDSDQSTLINRQVSGKSNYQPSSKDFQFSAAVAGFGMILRDSPYKGDLTYDQVLVMAKSTSDPDDDDRQEFIRMVEVASLLAQ